MPFGIGPLELIILVVILLLVFGAKRLPEIGRGLGSSAREFKEGITGDKDGDDTVSSTRKDDDSTKV